jgi:hypothetical protein
VIKAVEPYDADQDEIGRDNIIQQSRHEQNQDAASESSERHDLMDHGAQPHSGTSFLRLLNYLLVTLSCAASAKGESLVLVPAVSTCHQNLKPRASQSRRVSIAETHSSLAGASSSAAVAGGSKRCVAMTARSSATRASVVASFSIDAV